MVDFHDVCKDIYYAFLRAGNTGIEMIGETKDAWIFSPKSEDTTETEYGSQLYVVDKRTGEIREFDFFDDTDRKIYLSATKVEVPKDFRD